MTFFQQPPQLNHPLHGDRLLREYIERHFPETYRAEILPELTALGDQIQRELYPHALENRLEKPTLVQWDAWGNRADEIKVPEAWERFARIATEQGLIWRGYDKRYGEVARLDQFVRAYLLDRVTHTYNCPLAMTDGTTRTLLSHGNEAIRERALPNLLERTPGKAWTAGQWMTERTGGSDVGISETRAVKTEDGWRLYGTKWFTSATTSEIALTLARPEGNPAGGKGLALFYIEQRNKEGKLQGIRVNRLKEKLGTWMLPTAELTLDGVPAIPVAGLSNGIRNISPLLNVTRTWNSVCAVASMRHGIRLAKDYATKRVAFGRPLSEQPLHVDTLAGMQAEFEAAFHLTFAQVRLLGKSDCGATTESEEKALRLLFPLVKLSTARMAVANATESLEAFGGAGYVEDTGLPQLLRDTQVLAIWEGTTNVLSLDGLRAIAREDALPSFLEMMSSLLDGTQEPEAKKLGAHGLNVARQAAHWLQENQNRRAALESGARRFALTLSRSMALVLMANHASWASLKEGESSASLAAARRFAIHGVNQLPGNDISESDSALLAADPVES